LLVVDGNYSSGRELEHICIQKGFLFIRIRVFVWRTHLPEEVLFLINRPRSRIEEDTERAFRLWLQEF
jgi:hypothetical protein